MSLRFLLPPINLSKYFMQLLHLTTGNNLLHRLLYTHGAGKMAPITFTSLQRIPLSYASCSIGCRPSDTLPRKLEAISKAGFSSIELSFPDIIDYGTHLLGHPIKPDNYTELLSISAEIKNICDANSLSIMMLQPFANFEGWPNGSPEREDAFSRAKGWIEIMRTVGTDLLQVCPCNCLKQPAIKTRRSPDITSGLTRHPGWSHRYTIPQDLDQPRRHRR